MQNELHTSEPRIGVIGATGAVGVVTLGLLAERGYGNVRVFASARSAGKAVAFGDRTLTIEEATPKTLAAGDLDLALFSVGTSASRALVPHAAAGGAFVVDKSSAFRLVDGYPLVVPEVNGNRALEVIGTHRIAANPNCCTIPLTCVLKPLHDAAGLKSVRVATYQSVSGAGWQRMEQLRAEPVAEHNLVMDWSWEDDESDEESKLRAETRKILELPDLPVSATCVRVPVLISHSEAIWAEFEDDIAPAQAAELLRGSASIRVIDLPQFPTPKDAAGGDDILVGRIRRDGAAANGLALYLSNDNLRKGAALNAIQIAELVLAAQTAAV
jgi:aspartate-semialdehyde dehydrogenase